MWAAPRLAELAADAEAIVACAHQVRQVLGGHRPGHAVNEPAGGPADGDDFAGGRPS